MKKRSDINNGIMIKWIHVEILQHLHITETVMRQLMAVEMEP